MFDKVLSILTYCWIGVESVFIFGQSDVWSAWNLGIFENHISESSRFLLEKPNIAITRKYVGKRFVCCEKTNLETSVLHAMIGLIVHAATQPSANTEISKTVHGSLVHGHVWRCRDIVSAFIR